MKTPRRIKVHTKQYIKHNTARNMISISIKSLDIKYSSMVLGEYMHLQFPQSDCNSRLYEYSDKTFFVREEILLHEMNKWEVSEWLL